MLALPEVSAASTVAAYIARTGEPDTAPLLQELARRGVQVLLPILLPDMDLDWGLDEDARVHSTLTPRLVEPSGRRLGVAGIARADVVVVPALAVDRAGYRLGYGGGCYDRALARARPDAVRVALLHDGELSEEPLPHEPHDQRVQAVATPAGVVRL